MIQSKTKNKVIKVIQGLRGGKNLTQALKTANILRGHFYSARDAMLRDGDPVVTKWIAKHDKVLRGEGSKKQQTKKDPKKSVDAQLTQLSGFQLKLNKAILNLESAARQYRLAVAAMRAKNNA